MKTFLFLLLKITGWPMSAILFRRRTYFENRHLQTRKLPKGALVVSNHRSWLDYAVVLFLFFFKKVRPVVSYEIYHKNKALTYVLDVLGAIPLSEYSWDPTYVDKAVEELRKGHCVLIFPEGHFAKTEELLPFGNIYLRIAEQACAPIIPIYTDGNYLSIHRNRVMIGAPYYVDASDMSKNNIEKSNGEVVAKMEYMKGEIKRRKQNPVFAPKDILLDIGRFAMYAHFNFAYRVHTVDRMKTHRYHQLSGAFVIAANHSNFCDPLVANIAFWRRRINMLIAKEVYGGRKLREFGLNHLGGIKLDRSTLDIEAIDKAIGSLNRGRPVLVFGQGKIERNGNLTGFKDGASLFASKAGVPILPVYICPCRWYQTHYIYIGEFIYPEGSGRKALAATTEKVDHAVAELEAFAKQEREK